MNKILILTQSHGSNQVEIINTEEKLQYYGNRGWHQPLSSWHCESSSYSDAQVTGTGWDRPSLVFSPKCWGCLPVLLPWIPSPSFHIFLFTLSSALFVHFHHFCSIIRSVTLLLLLLFWILLFLILYLLSVWNVLKCVKCSWTFWWGSVKSQVEVL